MRYKVFSMGVVLLLLVLQAGCGTQGHRARQYGAEFGSWPEDIQQRVLSGVVREGDSREMVYIALGSPLRVLSHGSWERWEYLGWVDDGVGEAVVRTTNDAGLPSSWSGREPVVWLVDFRSGVVIASVRDDREERPALRQGLAPMRLPESRVN